jgi:hypothetical protein
MIVDSSDGSLNYGGLFLNDGRSNQREPPWTEQVEDGCQLFAPVPFIERKKPFRRGFLLFMVAR